MPENGLKVVVAGSGASLLHDRALIRQIKGTIWHKTDPRFFIILLLSLFLHVAVLYRISTIKIKTVEVTVIEKIPERFAKLIVDKPMPKEAPKKEITDKTKVKKEETTAKTETITEQTGGETIKTERKAAQKAVAARAAKVENKIRTVGVLGMLTGVGSTAKGGSVADVLGGSNRNKERFVDLEKALSDMSGLQKTKDADIMSQKLVRSKDVSVAYKEKIDDLVAAVENAKTKTLDKKGDFIIQRPESIEGAASSSDKRDNDAINRLVTSNKTSIRMSYEKFLERTPDLNGKITIRFTITASGKVTDIQVLENTTGNADLEKEITRKIRMWQFEEIADGDVTVTYPFIFRPS